MLDIERVLKQDRLLRALTGLNRKVFEELLIAFSLIRRQLKTAKTTINTFVQSFAI
jgi:hypothetical protein